MKDKIRFGLKRIPAQAIAVTAAVIMVCSCSKKDAAVSQNTNQSQASGSHMRVTDCTNPFDWIGTSHNEALAIAMTTIPRPSNPDDVLGLSKSQVSALTQDISARALIGSYPKSKLATSSKLANALIASDDNTIAQYCTLDEAVLLKQLFTITNQNLEIPAAIAQVRDWACGVQNNSALSTTMKEQMQVTGAVMIKSMEYWHSVLGGTTGTSRHCFGGDAAGAFIGFGFGGCWGAVIGAVTGSILVGCFGWELNIT